MSHSTGNKKSGRVLDQNWINEVSRQSVEKAAEARKAMLPPAQSASPLPSPLMPLSLPTPHGSTNIYFGSGAPVCPAGHEVDAQEWIQTMDVESMEDIESVMSTQSRISIDTQGLASVGHREDTSEVSAIMSKFVQIFPLLNNSYEVIADCMFEGAPVFFIVVSGFPCYAQDKQLTQLWKTLRREHNAYDMKVDVEGKLYICCRSMDV